MVDMNRDSERGDCPGCKLRSTGVMFLSFAGEVDEDFEILTSELKDRGVITDMQHAQIDFALVTAVGALRSASAAIGAALNEHHS